MKQERVSMPMASAGIIGFSPDIKVNAQEVDPKVLIAIVVGLVVVINIAAFALRH